MKKQFIIHAALILALSGMLFITGCGKLKATTMRLLRYEGNVTREESGKPASLREDLRLFSGDSLDTGKDSLASVGLDDVKIVTLDQNSRAEFSQAGKKLDLELTRGKLFFEVSKKLEEDETFEIRTSTMVVGIRGTSGLIEVDNDGEASITVTDGTVSVKIVNPSNGESLTTEVKAGEKLTVIIYPDRETDSISFEIINIYGGELPDFARNIILDDEELLDKVLNDTGWIGMSQLPDAEEGADEESDTAEDADDTTDKSDTEPDEDELYDRLTELFEANDQLGIKELLVEYQDDNSVIRSWLVDMPADPYAGEDPHPEYANPGFFSKVFVLNGELSNLKNGDIIIKLQRMTNLVQHYSDYLSVVQVLDQTAFSLSESVNDYGDGLFRSIDMASTSAYKEFRVYDLSLSAFLTEKYYYLFETDGNIVVYDFDSDEIYQSSVREEPNYIQY